MAGRTEAEQALSVQSTGGSGSLGSEAQTLLSGLANSLGGNSQQAAASTQGTGETCEPSCKAVCHATCTLNPEAHWPMAAGAAGNPDETGP